MNGSSETRTETALYINREAYRQWRKAMMAVKPLLFSNPPASQINKWLGAMPMPDSLPVESRPVESLPEPSRPVESLPEPSRPDKRQRDDALALAIRAALAAGVIARPRELFAYLATSDATLTITGVSNDNQALLWESDSGSLQKTKLRALAKRLKRLQGG